MCICVFVVHIHYYTHVTIIGEGVKTGILVTQTWTEKSKTQPHKDSFIPLGEIKLAAVI